MDLDEDFTTAGPIGPKTKTFASVPEILAKLEGKVALWERTGRDAFERAGDFERAAQRIREGATSVTIGRTTYVLTEGEPAPGHDLVVGTLEEVLEDLDAQTDPAAQTAAARFRDGEAGPIIIGRRVYRIGRSYRA
ncbi:hypothetical protein HXS80_16025 [Streptomyces sp. CB04723]|uniref:hypothetical protein n=1 Tax=Streptomyces TaxID=1883 RepID=UPI0015C490DC|nr:hypothetical protein [Streptomyces sp. CB04723]QLG33035.1 hypothetical protein HXS80_16025 [Streptomyces sp. CB04723]